MNNKLKYLLTIWVLLCSVAYPVYAEDSVILPPIIIPGGMAGTGLVNPNVVHTFDLSCDIQNLNNSLTVIWKSKANIFELDSVSSALCLNDPQLGIILPEKQFNTYIGNGIGFYNQKPGYTIAWTFTDAISPIQLNPWIPKRVDEATISIRDPRGIEILSSSGSLVKGAHQVNSQ